MPKVFTSGFVWISFAAAAQVAMAQPPTCPPVRVRTLDLTPGVSGTGATGLTTDGSRVLLSGRAGTQGGIFAWDGMHDASLLSSGATAPYGIGHSEVVNGRWFGSDLFAVRTSDLSTPLTAIPTSRGTFATIPGSEGARVLLAAESFQLGREIFISDGTVAGTQLLVDLAEGASGSNPSSFQQLGSRIAFAAWTPSLEYEWWTTDGTFAGTVALGDHSNTTRGAADSGAAYGVTGSPPCLYFMSPQAVGGGSSYRLFRSDGTPEGTILVSTPGQIVRRYANGTLLGVGAGQAFFQSEIEGQGTEVFVTDGTLEGTRLLRDFSPGPANTLLNAVLDSGDRALIHVFVNAATPNVAAAWQVWAFDRTDGSLTQIASAAVNSMVISQVFGRNVTTGDGISYFGAYLQSVPGGLSIIRSDGTPEGTCVVFDSPAPRDLNYQYEYALTLLRSRLFFVAFDTTYGHELRVLDLCPPDFDNSGAVAVADLFAFLTDWFTPDPPNPAADFNADSEVTSQDIFDFLAAWFTGC